jgi:3-dehydrosphinganine reductase
MTTHYYQNKTALITGGSSGIGLALASRLLEFGASVTLLARNQQKLVNAKSSLLSVNENFVVNTITADVTEVDSLHKSLSVYQAQHGTPDILINSAGVARPGYVEELPLEVYRWTMDIDYHGTVNMVKLFLPGMLERGSGHIINISSMAGIVGVFGYTAYSGAKFAVKGFSDVLRSELKPRGIKVSVVFPPDTNTPQLAWEDQFKPEETRIISGTSKPISADEVANWALKQAAKGKYAIVPGTEAKLLYLLATRLGDWVYPILDLMVKDAIRKKSK